MAGSVQSTPEAHATHFPALQTEPVAVPQGVPSFTVPVITQAIPPSHAYVPVSQSEGVQLPPAVQVDPASAT
jgi:hypothetical protein